MFKDLYKGFWVSVMGLFMFLHTYPNLRKIVSGLASASKILSIINQTPEIKLDDSQGDKISDIDSDIQFNNVSYQYASKDTLILDNINFSFQNGKTTALVGESG